MQRVIDLLFYAAIVLAVSLLVASYAKADTSKAMTALRQTTVRVDGNGCMGSGSIVEGKSGKHFLISNAHVCQCARWKGEIYATFEGGQLVTGKVVKQDWSSDLCAAEVSNAYAALKLGRVLLPLTEVNSRGYPGGRLTESHGRVHGIVQWGYFMDIGMLGECPSVSKKHYDMNDKLDGCTLQFTSVVTDLYARPGASGSPVVNDNGELVGVISSWLADNDYEAGAVPFSRVKEFLGGL